MGDFYAPRAIVSLSCKIDGNRVRGWLRPEKQLHGDRHKRELAQDSLALPVCSWSTKSCFYDSISLVPIA
jgi:hypothetical protein